MQLTAFSTRDFRLDIQSSQQHKAKHYFPSFAIRFTEQHSFTDSIGDQETLPPQDYKGQLH